MGVRNLVAKRPRRGGRFYPSVRRTRPTRFKDRTMSIDHLESILAEDDATHEARRLAAEKHEARLTAFTGPCAMLTADRQLWEKNRGPLTDIAYCDALASAYVQFGAALKQFGEEWKLGRVGPPSNVQDTAAKAYREQVRLIGLGVEGKHDEIRQALQRTLKHLQKHRSGFAWHFFRWMESDGLPNEIINFTEPPVAANDNAERRGNVVGGAHGHLSAAVAWKEPARSPLPGLSLEQQSRYCQGFAPDWWIPDLECPNWQTNIYPRHRTKESVVDWIAGVETLIRANYGGFQDPAAAAKLKSQLDNDLAIIRRFAPELLEPESPQGTRESEGGKTTARRRGTPKAEAEIKVREWLAANAKDDPAAITRDAVAAGVEVSGATVSRTASWKAFQDRRRTEKATALREIPLTASMQASIPSRCERPDELAALIEEQKADDAGQLRRSENRSGS